MSTTSSAARVQTARARLGSRAEAALDRARLHVVPRVPTLRSSAPRIPFVTLVSVVLLGGVVGLLLFNTSMQQASFEATRLQGQADTLTARQQALRTDIDQLDDPQTIGRRAGALGMVVPPASDYLDLDTGRITGHAPVATSLDRVPLGTVTPKPPAPRVVHTPAAPTTGTTPATGDTGTAGNAATSTTGTTGTTSTGTAHAPTGAAPGAGAGNVQSGRHPQHGTTTTDKTNRTRQQRLQQQSAQHEGTAARPPR